MIGGRFDGFSWNEICSWIDSYVCGTTFRIAQARSIFRHYRQLVMMAEPLKTGADRTTRNFGTVSVEKMGRRSLVEQYNQFLQLRTNIHSPSRNWASRPVIYLVDRTLFNPIGFVLLFRSNWLRDNDLPRVLLKPTSLSVGNQGQNN